VRPDKDAPGAERARSTAMIGGDSAHQVSKVPDREWGRLAAFAVASVVLLAGLVVAVLTVQAAAASGRIGADLELYLSATRRAIDGGGFYLPRQLAGPYELVDGDILYPPTAMLLFAPFLVLPSILFWIVPIAIVAVVVAIHRPRPAAWPILAACLAYPVSSLKVVHGNPVMWVTAALALGTILAWPAALALLKPTLAPLAVIGARSRSWWLAVIGLGLVSIPFGALWLQYASALRDAHTAHGILYSLDEVPLASLPIVAWLGAAKGRRRYWPLSAWRRARTPGGP
jgi:hypothetical protein